MKQTSLDQWQIVTNHPQRQERKKTMCVVAFPQYNRGIHVDVSFEQMVDAIAYGNTIKKYIISLDKYIVNSMSQLIQWNKEIMNDKIAVKPNIKSGSSCVL